jgi:hypothetical protein
MFFLDFPDRFFVFIIQIFRDEDFGDDDLVPFVVPALDAVAFDAEFRAAAGAGRDGQRHLAVQRRHIQFRAEDRLVQADRKIEINIQSLAAEKGMRADAGDDEEIARLAEGALLPAAADAHAAAVFHAGGDAHVDGFDFSVAVDLQRQTRSAGCLLKCERDGMIHIRAALRCWPGAGSAAATASTAEELLEYPAEISTAADIEIFHADARPALPGMGGAAALLGLSESFPGISLSARRWRVGADAKMAKFVVSLALGIIRKDVVSLLRFLEPLGRFGVVFRRIRMEFARQLAIGAANFVRCRFLGDAQNFVVIALCHARSSILASVLPM